jgi:TetR/AcrR family transcriptional regulator, tetracycline repressor protein
VAIIDGHGAEGVSMRAVANTLKVDAKSLYNHIDGKEALLDAVAERVLAGLRFPAVSGVLDDDLRAIARAFRRVALSHPRAAALILTRQLSSSAALAPVEAVVSLLRHAGFGPKEAVHLLRAFLATAIGTLLREANAGPTFGAADLAGIARRRATLVGSRMPAVVEAAPHLARCNHGEEFEFAIELVIDAVKARSRSASS